nr:MAG TPA: hypothetical protein [Caudoviricetes sp.]
MKRKKLGRINVCLAFLVYSLLYHELPILPCL